MKAKAMKIPFDTLAYIQTLRKSGIDEGCANAHAQALIMAFTQGVATHEDIEEMDARMSVEFINARSEMSQEFTKVRAEMFQEFTKVRSETAQEFTKVRSEMAQGFTKVRSEMAQGFTKMRILVIATLVLVALTNPVALHILHVTGLLH